MGRLRSCTFAGGCLGALDGEVVDRAVLKRMLQVQLSEGPSAATGVGGNAGPSSWVPIETVSLTEGDVRAVSIQRESRLPLRQTRGPVRNEKKGR